MYDNTWKCVEIQLYFAPKDKNLRGGAAAVVVVVVVLVTVVVVVVVVVVAAVVAVVVVSHISKYGRRRSTGVCSS